MEPGKAAETDDSLLLVVVGVVVVGVVAEVVDAGELIGAAVGRKEGMGSVSSCCMRTGESGDERCIGETVEESMAMSSLLLFTDEQYQRCPHSPFRTAGALAQSVCRGVRLFGDLRKS